MADVFALSGTYTTTPAATISADPTLTAAIDESLAIDAKAIREVTIQNGVVTPVSVDMSELPVGAHVLVIRAVGAKVRARITTSDGAQQSVPVDPFFVMMSSAVPVTALDLTLVSGGATTTIKVFLGEKA